MRREAFGPVGHRPARPRGGLVTRLGTAAALLAAILVLAAAVPLTARAAESAPVTTPRSVASLVTDVDSAAPGMPFRAALRLRLAEGWHTYWRNPGDAGVAPELEFTLPTGWRAGPVVWPAPRRLTEGGLVTFGYTGDLLLPVTVTPGPAPGQVDLRANWLVCAKICVPEDGVFRVDVPPTAGAPRASAQVGLFGAFESLLPRPSPWPATIARDGRLSLTGADIDPADIGSATFMPGSWGEVVPAAPQPLMVDAGALTLNLTPGPSFRPDAPLRGVLVVADRSGRETVLDVSAEPGVAPAPTAAPAAPPMPLGRLLLFAALGGLILNLMPCVFPVLAMKAMGVLRLGSPRAARTHALAYTFGVIVSFLAVAGALLGLRGAGLAVGWGFQFQSPAFVTVLTWLVFLIGLNLSGVFTLGGRLMGVGQGGLVGRWRTGGGHLGSVLTGVLAVVVATPCTAPFMGAAVAAGLTAPPAVTVAVFAAMGAGLAAPYLLLGFVPGFARLLPRPGAWMETVKQALAFPMYAACVWLIWVASVQSGPSGVLAVGSGLLLLGLGAWALGRAQAVGGAGAAGQRVAHTVAGAAVLATAAILLHVLSAPAAADADGVGAGAVRPMPVGEAEPFTPARLQRLRAAGRPVFVNMTAAWCVTCIVNEHVALSSADVRDAFAARGVAYLQGDWTRRDRGITDYLRMQGRDGVPLYALYPAGDGPPEILPQLLTPAIVLAALDRAVR